MLATSHLIHAAPQLARLGDLIPHWREVPLYQDRLADGENPGTSPDDWEEFFGLPLLTKRDISQGFPRNFLRPGQTLEALLDGELVELEHTSGTSEERMPVLLGRGWWNEQEARALRLNRFVDRVLDECPLPRRVLITTPLCNGTACHSRWTPRSARIVGQGLSVNQARIPFVLPDSELARMAEETLAWAPQFLDLDPVHGAWFARYCEREGIRFPSLRFVLCSYEFVSVVHRRILERAFRVPVFSLYGSTETGHLLMEDERGTMQPSLETAFLETVEPDAQGIGHLVVTTLTNQYMPLLRYRIGDLVEPTRHAGDLTYIVHGRARDALQDDAGRRVTTWQVDQCFEGLGGVAHYELRHTGNGEVRLRFVPDGTGPSARELRELDRRLAALLGLSGRVAMEPVQLLLPTASGKFRLTAPD